MDLVAGAMGNLAPKLLKLLQDQYKLQKGVKKQVESLSLELESIHAALLKVGKVPPDQLDEPVKIWARQVREASYDMEDVLDIFLIRVEHGDEPTHQGRLKRAIEKMGALFNKGKARNEIASIIEDIKKKLQEVAERRDRYKIDGIVAKPAAITGIDPRLSVLYTDGSKLVGINEPRDALIEMLSIGQNDTSSKDKIVSIVGSGGLGKTTLANVAYEKVRMRFDCWAFVPVGQNPEPKKVLWDILIGLIDCKKNSEKNHYNTSVEMLALDERQLIDKLREFLGGKRYLIVVDDIWDKEIWDKAIKLGFVDSDRGSRIIIITRKLEVAKEIRGQVYKIKELSDDNSRELLYTRAFGKEQKWPDNNEVAGKILQKCHGVPLAIIAVASMLSEKHIDEWANVYQSIGFEREQNTQVDNIMKILSFSYYDLPCHLRTCMLYLSVFPEDYYVDRNMLIWRWIAEGLVQQEKGKGLFEIGDRYFHELINRGLLLPSITSLGMLGGCRVHDFILALIRGLSSDDNFVHVPDSEQWSLSLPADRKVRRLALQNLSDTNHSWTTRVDEICLPEARSFNAITCQSQLIPPVAGFKLLRVLALEQCSVDEGYLKHIGKLLHLRYLGLTGTPTKKLPEEVGYLKFLQTLMLLGPDGIEELPESLKLCKELMCLCTGWYTRVPDWIGEMTSLVELQMYHNIGGGRFLKELCNLSNLRELDIWMRDLHDEGQARILLESLSKLEMLETMNVDGCEFELTESLLQLDLVFNCKRKLRILGLQLFGFPRMPTWINGQAFPNLCQLVLNFADAVEQQDMEILGTFQQLRALQLSAARPPSADVICGEGGFQNLVNLDLPMNPRMKFVAGAMPRLQCIWFPIVVVNVNKEHTIRCFVLDMGMGNLCSLQQVDVMIDCTGCFPAEADQVEAAVRYQVDNLPNRPKLSMKRLGEDTMATTASGLQHRILNLQSPEGELQARFYDQFSIRPQMYIDIIKLLQTTHDETEGLRYMYQLWDIQDVVMEGRIVWRSEVDYNEGHPNYINRAMLVQQRLNERYAAKEQELPQLNQCPDLKQVKENCAAMEAILERINVTNSRLTAMLEELKAKQCSPTTKDAGADTVANNVTKETEAEGPVHLSSDQ